MARLRTVWKGIASLFLSVWLLVISSVVVLFNSELAVRQSGLYQKLNTTPLWCWLDQTCHGDLLVFIAVLMLIVSLGALGLNTLACTITRLAELNRLKGKKRGSGKAFVAWAPTLMHVLFFLILASHMATFSFGQWRQYTVRQGESLHFSRDFYPLTITSFSRSVRQDEGPLQGSTISHQVGLQIGGRSTIISELHPLRLPNGDWLVFMPPQQRGNKRPHPDRQSTGGLQR